MCNIIKHTDLLSSKTAVFKKKSQKKDFNTSVQDWVDSTHLFNQIQKLPIQDCVTNYWHNPKFLPLLMEEIEYKQRCWMTILQHGICKRDGKSNKKRMEKMLPLLVLNAIGLRL
ncbi:hypothetical protein CW304_21285 [Bacillus sp. UFRGS-B20]|nr:hypothetical protein CW304_21285 [Bacillus sp. UFRGS-B20]